jgi:hypothetical protein
MYGHNTYGHFIRYMLAWYLLRVYYIIMLNECVYGFDIVHNFYTLHLS